MMRLLLAWPLLLSGVSPVQEKTGAVSGVVRFEGTHTPRKVNALIDSMKHGAPPRGDKDVFDESVLVGAEGRLANVLVRIKSPVKGEFAVPATPAELDAAGWFFKPHVVALRAGQVLNLKVSGLDRANFSSKPRINTAFNVGFGKGSIHEVKHVLPEIGILVQHDCCPFQRAWIHVLDHPFFAVTGPDGTFEIKGLPAGEYEIEAWHEVFGAKSATVKVGAKETKAQDFTFVRK